MEVTENFFGPEIDAAFAGITVGEFDDSDALGKEKRMSEMIQSQDGDAPVSSNGGDDVQVEDGDHEQED